MSEENVLDHLEEMTGKMDSEKEKYKDKMEKIERAKKLMPQLKKVQNALVNFKGVPECRITKKALQGQDSTIKDAIVVDDGDDKCVILDKYHFKLGTFKKKKGSACPKDCSGDKDCVLEDITPTPAKNCQWEQLYAKGVNVKVFPDEGVMQVGQVTHPVWIDEKTRAEIGPHKTMFEGVVEMPPSEDNKYLVTIKSNHPENVLTDLHVAGGAVLRYNGETWMQLLPNENKIKMNIELVNDSDGTLDILEGDYNVVSLNDDDTFTLNLSMPASVFTLEQCGKTTVKVRNKKASFVNISLDLPQCGKTQSNMILSWSICCGWFLMTLCAIGICRLIKVSNRSVVKLSRNCALFSTLVPCCFAIHFCYFYRAIGCPRQDYVEETPQGLCRNNIKKIRSDLYERLLFVYATKFVGFTLSAIFWTCGFFMLLERPANKFRVGYLKLGTICSIFSLSANFVNYYYLLNLLLKGTWSLLRLTAKDYVDIMIFACAFYFTKQSNALSNLYTSKRSRDQSAISKQNVGQTLKFTTDNGWCLNDKPIKLPYKARDSIDQVEYKVKNVEDGFVTVENVENSMPTEIPVPVSTPEVQGAAVVPIQQGDTFHRLKVDKTPCKVRLDDNTVQVNEKQYQVDWTTAPEINDQDKNNLTIQEGKDTFNILKDSNIVGKFEKKDQVQEFDNDTPCKVGENTVQVNEKDYQVNWQRKPQVDLENLTIQKGTDDTFNILNDSNTVVGVFRLPPVLTVDKTPCEVRLDDNTVRVNEKWYQVHWKKTPERKKIESASLEIVTEEDAFHVLNDRKEIVGKFEKNVYECNGHQVIFLRGVNFKHEILTVADAKDSNEFFNSLADDARQIVEFDEDRTKTYNVFPTVSSSPTLIQGFLMPVKLFGIPMTVQKKLRWTILASCIITWYFAVSKLIDLCSLLRYPDIHIQGSMKQYRMNQLLGFEGLSHITSDNYSYLNWSLSRFPRFMNWKRDDDEGKNLVASLCQKKRNKQE